jgi:hypothetical protein
MDAIRFHRKGRLRVKLIGQHPLNQLSSLAAAVGPGTQRRHLDAAFLPIEMKPGPATLYQSDGFRAAATAITMIAARTVLHAGDILMVRPADDDRSTDCLRPAPAIDRLKARPAPTGVGSNVG